MKLIYNEELDSLLFLERNEIITDDLIYKGQKRWYTDIVSFICRVLYINDPFKWKLIMER